MFNPTAICLITNHACHHAPTTFLTPYISISACQQLQCWHKTKQAKNGWQMSLHNHWITLLWCHTHCCKIYNLWNNSKWNGIPSLPKDSQKSMFHDIIYKFESQLLVTKNMKMGQQCISIEGSLIWDSYFHSTNRINLCLVHHKPMMSTPNLLDQKL